MAAGLDPDVQRYPKPLRTIYSDGRADLLPIREADLWLLGNVPAEPPFCLTLDRGVPFRDVATIPHERPLIGMRSLLRAGVRIEIDCSVPCVSLWVP